MPITLEIQKRKHLPRLMKFTIYFDVINKVWFLAKGVKFEAAHPVDGIYRVVELVDVHLKGFNDLSFEATICEHEGKNYMTSPALEVD